MWARASTFSLGLVCWLAAGQAAAQAPASAATVIAELRQHRAAEALRDASSALAADPQDDRLWTLKGVAAEQTGQPALALSAFQSALRLKPNSVPALEGASETAFRIDSPQAPELTARLLTLQPGNLTEHAVAGMLAFRAGKWEEAAAHFEQAGPAMLPQQSALEAQAITLDHLGRQGEAEAVLKHVMEAWPADNDARYDLAVLETREKHPADALGTLAPLLAAHDERTLALAANAWEAQGKTPEAAAALHDAIEHHPGNPDNYLQFAALSFDHNSYAAGISMLSFGLKKIPNAASLYIARGALLMQVNRIDEAERDFATANRLDPSQSFGFEAQGLSAIQRHDLPAALAGIRASLRLSPGNAYLHYLAAEVLKEAGAAPGSGEASEAMAQAGEALALDSNLLAARNLLAELQFEARNYPEAARQSRLVLAQSPADCEAIYRLILVLRRSSNNAEGSRDEIAQLVDRLKDARSGEQMKAVRVDKYRLSVASKHHDRPLAAS